MAHLRFHCKWYLSYVVMFCLFLWALESSGILITRSLHFDKNIIEYLLKPVKRQSLVLSNYFIAWLLHWIWWKFIRKVSSRNKSQRFLSIHTNVTSLSRYLLICYRFHRESGLKELLAQRRLTFSPKREILLRQRFLRSFTKSQILCYWSIFHIAWIHFTSVAFDAKTDHKGKERDWDVPRNFHWIFRVWLSICMINYCQFSSTENS